MVSIWTKFNGHNTNLISLNERNTINRKLITTQILEYYHGL
jgi:hypothetical protein